VIAGAGSGKTSTLAHRVAHLIINGADPRRLLLMTFSRRAAAEMTRRVERIARTVTGRGVVDVPDSLEWVGTFHAIGARLLRECAVAACRARAGRRRFPDCSWRRVAPCARRNHLT
jgi:DNA helicase-2/ATP-dependent DNA helicase PcrA